MIDNTVEFEADVSATLDPFGYPVLLAKLPPLESGHYRVTLTRLDEPKPEVQYRGKSLSQMTREELEAEIAKMTAGIAKSNGWCLSRMKRAKEGLSMLRGELATRREPESESRYPMCADQSAQVDCLRTKCRYHRMGKCTNESPAITLGENGAGRCWSYKQA